MLNLTHAKPNWARLLNSTSIRYRGIVHIFFFPQVCSLVWNCCCQNLRCRFGCTNAARVYKGHKGSMDTILTGLAVRLDEGGKAENLEPDFPVIWPDHLCG